MGMRCRAGYGASLLLAQAGCSGAHAPSLPFAGAYFPAWMFCLGFGVLVALLARAAMLATGLAERLPLQLFVSTAVGLIAALALARFWFAA
jgi:hypothetical protein